MPRRQYLHSGWVTRPEVGTLPEDAPAWPADLQIPAQVPGTVHTDLLAAGLIPDPYLDANEAGLRWIWRTNWQYETTFAWSGDDADRTDLVCDGLDTVATVELNGTTVATTQNMHRSYRFDVGALLQPGDNRLVITFTSALNFAEQERDRMGFLPIPNSASVHPINFIRKMACNFGWDWGPVLITAGIWRPISLESWSTARLAEVRPKVTVDGGRGRVRIDVDIERAGTPTPVRIVATIAGQRADAVVEPGTDAATLEMEVADPALWWPHGYGKQPLHDLQVELVDASHEVGSAPRLDTWSRRVGFRSVELDRTEDDLGSAFTFVVNGTPLFAKGANWIPDDCFPTRIGAQRYRERLVQARDANIDLLRVWGGGIYESDDFYEACDELGIMVWQDFLFACAAYPEEEPIRSEVAAEAAQNVVRLMPHPSLVLWNGNNENFMGWHEWGWPAVVGNRTWGLGYYTELLPQIVGHLDGTRPYWPGSPYSGSPDRLSGLDGHGCTHLWDVWNTADYPVYRRHVPRFVSEFGWQAPPTWATLTQSVHDEPLLPDSRGVLAHQKATDGNGKLARGLAPHFPTPTTMEDWHFANQLNQCRAIATAIEHFRSHRGACMGTIVWQLNDCWPVTSWAAIDGYGRLKPLWYTLRRVYQPRLLTVQPRDEALHAVLVNDTSTPWDSPVVVRRIDADGTVLATWEAAGSVAPASVSNLAIPVDVATPTQPERELLVVMAGEQRATWFFVEDKDFTYPQPELDVEVDGGTNPVVRVTARTLVRDLALFADRLDPAAEVDDMLVTLLPGESREFRVSGVTGLAAADLRFPVLRSANDVVLRSGSVSRWREPIVSIAAAPVPSLTEVLTGLG
jgi:beta-mannosidase